MAEKEWGEFDFNGRPARITGSNVGSPSDPMGRRGAPRSAPALKRRRMLARDKRTKERKR